MTPIDLQLIVEDIRARADSWRHQEMDEVTHGCLQCSREARLRAAVLEQLATDYELAATKLTRVA